MPWSPSIASYLRSERSSDVTKTLVISRVFPPRVGGSGNWMWELYSRLPLGQYIVAADRSPGSDEFDRRHRLPIKRLSLDLPSWGAFGVGSGSAYARLYRQLVGLARQHDVRAVHAACCLPEGFLAWLVSRRLRIPYLVHAHGEEINVVGSSRELTWMARRVYENAGMIIANSRNTARLAQAKWPSTSDRLQVLSPGVDTQRFCPAPRNLDVRGELGWGDRPVVLTVGRLQKRKGHETMIRALPSILKQSPQVLYAIAGDGDQRAELEQLVDRLGLKASVRFHGESTSDELLSMYQQCDLFVLPNREVAGDIEGFGIVLLEAQACGAAVIAGNSGGTSEAIDAPNSGLVIDCTSPNVLGEKVAELLADAQTRQNLGTTARDWTVRSCDWRTRAIASESVFESLGHGTFVPASATA